MNDSIHAIGAVRIEIRSADGQLKDHREVTNLVMTNGKNRMASRWANAGTAPSHIAIGTGTVAPAAGDTALGAEQARVASTPSASGAVATFSATFGTNVPTTAQSITEAGLLDAATGGTLLQRVTFAAINKGTGDSLTITWNVTFS